jgi:hypothetical protein
MTFRQVKLFLTVTPATEKFTATTYEFQTVDWKEEISAKFVTFIEIFCVNFYRSLGSPNINVQTEHVTPSLCVTAWRLACLSRVLHIAATRPL